MYLGTSMSVASYRYGVLDMYMWCALASDLSLTAPLSTKQAISGMKGQASKEGQVAQINRQQVANYFSYLVLNSPSHSYIIQCITEPQYYCNVTVQLFSNKAHRNACQNVWKLDIIFHVNASQLQLTKYHHSYLVMYYIVT